MSNWIKNSRGEPSASLTLVAVAFSVIMLHMIASIFAGPLGIVVPPFAASEAMMVLGPLLATYWGRRNTEVKEKEVDLKHK